MYKLTILSYRITSKIERNLKTKTITINEIHNWLSNKISHDRTKLNEVDNFTRPE